MGGSSVSLVIPTYNAGDEFGQLLEALAAQTQSLEVLVVDSGSADSTISIASSFPFVRVRSIRREEFDHGATRHMAFKETTGEIVVFMTQDAVPANDQTIEFLIAPFEDEEVSMTYGRQLPRPAAGRYESLVRQYNYPCKSTIKTKKDVDTLGIKAFFASDSCAAYRRKAYFDLGGFERPCPSNEDMFMAAKIINAGMKVGYVADACVLHSHDLTFFQQLHRTALSTRAMRSHRELLGSAAVMGEGISMVREVSKKLFIEHEYNQLFKMFSDCVARLLGSRLYKCFSKGD